MISIASQPAARLRTPRPNLRRLFIAGLILILFLVGYYVYAVFINRPAAEVYIVQRGTAVAAVYGTVTVTSKRTLVITAQNSGVLKMSPGFTSIVESNGTAVKQNDLLATVFDEVGQRARDQARTDYEAALAHQKLGPGSAQSLKIARDQLTAWDHLPTNVVARVQQEAARQDAAHLDMVVQNEALELQRQLDTTAAIFHTCEENLKRTEIRAPIDGIIVVPYYNDGAYVASGAPLFSVSSKDLYVSGLVNEEDVGKLRTGMKAEMHLYAYGNTPFAATVNAVQPNPEAGSSRYTVILYMDNPPDNLMFGLTGEMNVIQARKDDALIIPYRALLVDQVLSVVHGTVEQRTVKIGLKSLQLVEITEGLKVGDQVVVSDQDAFYAGQRVRPTPINDPSLPSPAEAKKR